MQVFSATQIATQNSGSAEARREQSLLKTGALQAAILNSANFSSIATDEHGVIQIFNVGAEQMLGFAAADVVNKLTPADISNPRELVTRAEALSLELGRPIAPGFEALVFKASRGIEDIYELTYIRKDGSWLPAVVSVTALRDGDGAIIGYLLIGTDNTARKQADEKVRSAAQHARSLIEASMDPLVTISVEGKITDVNEGSVKATGMPREKLIGTDFSDYFTEPERAREGYREAFSQGSVTDYPLTIRHTDGSLTEVLYNASVYRDVQGHVVGVVAAARDVTARKKAEAAVRKAGALQSAIFNSANFSSIATDAKGVIQIFNVGAERMLGYAAADVMNKVTPADISDPQELIARAAALSAELGSPITPGFSALAFKASRGIEDIYELTYIRKDGSRFPAVVSVTALRDADDTIIGYLLIGTDNTARKQAEDALRKAGALQSAIFNSANFSSIATDANGVIQIFNVGAERMLGYAAADVMNKVTPADLSDPQELIARATALSLELSTTIAPGFEALVFKARRGIEDKYELTYIRKDGTRFPAVVSVTALHDENQGIIGYLLIGTDNTSRLQIEEDLRWTQESFKLMIESVTDCAIIMLDLEGRVVSWNNGAQRIKGFAAEEIIGRHFSNFYLPEAVRAGTPKHDLAVAREEGRFEAEGWRVRKDGTAFWAQVTFTAIRDTRGRPRGFAKLTRDLTERREVEAELLGGRIAADAANLAKSEFLSGMSHELRTPLNAILGFAQLMESDMPPPTPPQGESITQIMQAGWHLLTLINEILDLAKIESGRVPMSREPVSLADVMRECQGMIEPQASSRSIQIIFPDIEPTDFFLADHTRLKQVILNLLSNAVKYNAIGGSVTIHCATNSHALTRVSITDTGAGLNAAQVAQLFQPFNRLGQEGGKEEGTGIGLVVCKRLVELMGGRIGVVSTPGMGSVFWFELSSVAAPDLAVERDTQLRQSSLPVLGGRPRTLLYVEDNPANLRLVEQIIARHPNISLTTAVTADDGILLARSQKPDVILMDINLPGMNGIQALKILRADPETSRIPVIAVSANAMPSDIKRALSAGFVRYITKPINIGEFMDALESAFIGRSQAAAPTGVVHD